MSEYKINCHDTKVWLKLGKWLKIISKNEMTFAEKGKTEYLLKDILKKSKFPSDEEYHLYWNEKNMLEMVLKNNMEKVHITLNEETFDEDREITFILRNGVKSFFIAKQHQEGVELELKEYWIKSDQTGNFLTRQILQGAYSVLLENYKHSIKISISSKEEKEDAINIEELENMLLTMDFDIEFQDLYKEVRKYLTRPLNTYHLELQMAKKQDGEFIITDKLDLIRGIPEEYMITQNGETRRTNRARNSWMYKAADTTWEKKTNGEIKSTNYWKEEEKITSIGLPDYLNAKEKIEHFRKLQREMFQD